MHVDTKIINGKKSAATKALIDSGAQGVFMGERFAKKHGLPLVKLSKEIPASNVDNTPNQNKPIKEYTRLLMIIDGKEFSTRFLVSNLGKEDLILGLPWLKRMNPEVDWEKQTLKIDLKKVKEPTYVQKVDRALQVQAIQKEQEKIKSQNRFADLLRKASQKQVKKKRSKVTIEEVTDKDATPKYERLPEGEKSLLIEIEQLPNAYEDMPALIPDEEDSDEEFEEELLIECLQKNTLTSDVLIKTSISQSLAHEHEAKEEKTFEDLVPKEYHKFRSIFKKKASKRFPESRPWDHKIELKETFVPKRAKLYPLGLKEEEEMNKFINENLKKGFIRPSTSPQVTSRRRCPYNTITIQIDNCPIASKATQMGPMLIQGMAP